MEALDFSKEFETRSYLRRLWPELNALKLSDLPTPILLSFPIPKRCFLRWLKANSSNPYFYFRNRSQDLELAGYGYYSNQKSRYISAHDWQELITLHPQKERLRLFFCRNFSAQETWGEFAHMRYFLPSVFCERSGESYLQTFIVPLREINSLKDLEQRAEALYELALNAECYELDTNLPALKDRKDTPTFIDWSKYIGRILKEIENGELQKVVPARRTDFLIDGQYDVFAILERLMQLKQNVYNYIYSPKTGQYFLGGTPERLFSYSDATIKTEALAGTSANCPSDDRQELFSKKNVLEHNLVIEGLKTRLQSLGCSHIDIKTAEIMPLSSMQHLHSPMQAACSKELLLEQIIDTLHPTAAVCGEPQDKAAALIQELEPFARGLYAGPIGIADASSIECAVALRSCLIQDNRIALFAGAGVVAGSEADKEWAELDTKISVIQNLFD